jgi:hypothetical protein
MTRPARIAIVSFVATSVVIGLALRLAQPTLARIALHHAFIKPDNLDPIAPELRAAPIAVVGDSLTAGLADALRPVLDENVRHRSLRGYSLGDELAQAMAAEQTGARAVVMELDPYMWNERVHIGASHPDRPIARENRHAAWLFGRASSELRREILRQLGVDGVLEALVEPLAPFALRASRLPSAWVAPLSERLFPHQEPTGPQPGRLFCPNWVRKQIEGVDSLVLEEAMRWAQAATPKLLVVFPPLNRAGIATCSADALDRIDRLTDWWKQRLSEHAIPFLDLAREIPPHGFADFGHFADERDFEWLAGLVAPRLRELLR